jgi:release factor glutamine methyltransferase
LGCSRSDLLLRHMGDIVPDIFADLVDRRATHEPVAYIVRAQEFYGRRFAVGPGVLIPRGDSETVIEAALAACPAPRRVLDCGVGSGALLLTILAERPGAIGTGIDASPLAVEIAGRNAATLGLADRATVATADWTRPGWAAGMAPFDLILANPPYVEADAALAPSVRLFEPAGALFAGAEGLDDYRVLVPQLPGLLAAGGVAVVEIGHAQAPAVAAIAAQAGLGAVLHRDLAGRPRALEMRVTQESAWQAPPASAK